MEASLLRMTVRCNNYAPAKVRRALAGCVQLDRIVEDMSLVASELVTNAVRHSGCTEDDLLDVHVGRVDDRVRVAVLDPGRATTTPRLAAPRGKGGMGLWVVEQLTMAWGSEKRADSRAVWAELPADRLVDPAGRRSTAPQ
jgi:anti-sigma regulatory factor (Ser/Thr protein kinase)